MARLHLRVLLSGLVLFLSPRAFAQPAPACADGRVPDSGHCCWPAQAWGEESGRCRGRPSCPKGLVEAGEDCVAPSCPEGEAFTADRLHCCWSGQEWSRERQACIGIPTCGGAFQLAASADRCVPAPPAPPPVPPSCDPPNVPSGGQCFSPLAWADEQRRQKWGDAAGVFGFGYEFLGSPRESLTTHSMQFTVGYHFDGFPLLLSGSFSVGGFWAPNARGTIMSERVGAAFAPFARISGAPWSVAPFNPFVGVDVVNVQLSDAHCVSGDCALPPSRVFPALVLGNVFFIERTTAISRLSFAVDSHGPVIGVTLELPGVFLALLGA